MVAASAHTNEIKKNNTMNKITSLLIALFATSSMVISACSDDNDSCNKPAASTGDVNVSVSELTFDYKNNEAKDTITFTVQGGVPYVKSSVDWMTVERTSETLNATSATYIAYCNTANEGTGSRTGELLINLNGAYKRLPVTQAAASYYSNTQEYSFRTATEIAADMYPGWNLGNTMDASDGETAWQTTTTTQAIIDLVKAQGFKSVRIPCAWNSFIDSQGNIDWTRLDRVREIVDYCVNDGLYVILNDHWDDGWIEELGFSKSSNRYWAVDDTDIAEKSARLQTLWTAIAEAFKNYDEHLIFAGLNEPFQNYDLFNDVSTSVLTPILNTYNQTFVNAVRATGGNNAKRTLIFQGSGANIDKACEDIFEIPADIDGQKGYLMAEVHFYDPYNFSLNESGTFYYWGVPNHVTGSSYNATYGEESYVKQQMAKLRTKFFDHGVPVLLGEFAAQWRDLSSVADADQSKHNASVKYWYSTVVSEAVSNGIVPVAWDTNSPNQNGTSGTSTIIDRAKLSLFGTYAMQGILEGVNAASWPK